MCLPSIVIPDVKAFLPSLIVIPVKSRGYAHDALIRSEIRHRNGAYSITSYSSQLNAVQASVRTLTDAQRFHCHIYIISLTLVGADWLPI